MVKNLPAKQETQKTWVRSLGLKISWRRKWQLTPIFLLELFFEKKLFILFNFIPECLHKMTFSFIATTVLSYLMKVKIQSFNIQLIFRFP